MIHHAEHPERIIAEIQRVLAPGGEFRGMFYKRWSLAVFKEWVKYGLLRGRPFRSFADVLAHHFESPGTKAYTLREMRGLFSAWREVTLCTAMTPYDLQHLPSFLSGWIPDSMGSFIVVRATK